MEADEPVAERRPPVKKGPAMLVAADYPFLEVFWTLVLFFAWVAWIWIVVTGLIDMFRRDDIGGWQRRAGWCSSSSSRSSGCWSI